MTLFWLVGVLDKYPPTYLTLTRGDHPVIVLKEFTLRDFDFDVSG